MKAIALLLELLRNGVQLWAEGNELCFRAAKGVLSPALREELSRHKPEIITLLAQRRRETDLLLSREFNFTAPRY